MDDKINVLESKIKKAVHLILELKKENAGLKEELSAMKKFAGDSDGLVKKNRELFSERKALAGRIDKVLKRLSLLEA